MYRAEPPLLDMDVKDALDLLIRHYRAEEEQMRPPEQRLDGLAQRVFGSVQTMCERRLGRASVADETLTPRETIPVSELSSAARDT